MYPSYTNKKLNILTLNVQGLRKQKTRSSIFYQLKKHKYDIVSLQETYILNEDRNLIEKEWPGHFILAEGTNHGRGLLTLFNPSIPKEDIRTIFINDRIIISEICFDQNKIVIINIYSPCIEKEKKAFLKQIYKTVTDNIDIEEKDFILMGDTNIVMSNTKDIIAGKPHSNKIVQSLNDLVNNLNVLDIWRIQHPETRSFTWSKFNRNTKYYTARRLDYLFISHSLLPFVTETEIVNLGFSDHKGSKLSLDFSAFSRGPSTFKLNINFLKDLSFINLIKNDIGQVKELENKYNPHILWEMLKSKIKSTSISFGKKKSLENKQNKSNLLEELNNLENELAENQNNYEIQEQIFKVKKNLELQLIKETEGSRIRARVKWVEEGERCNSYFLNLEGYNARNDTIFRLGDESGKILKDNDSILNQIKNYYKKLFKAPNHDQDTLDELFCTPDPARKLSEEKADSMDQSVSEREVLLALSSMKNGSAPGLDGLPAEVFKVFWIDLKDLFISNIKYSFEKNTLTDSQTHGVIKLLYKGNNSNKEDLNNWRPLSLLNADYKITAKIFARRLCTVLDEIIEPGQYGFIKGRQAGDMIRELDNIIELEKLKGNRSLMLSVDFFKAFDTLSTEAIIKALKCFGFKENFIKWVNILLSGRKSCVKNNNYTSDFFSMERGVRQGCPLSPYLFICAVELLARSIRNDEKIKGIILKGSNKPIKIRQFADDTTLFLRDLIDFREVLSKIKMFAKFSGMQLNTSKSKVMPMSNVQCPKEYMYGIQMVCKIKIVGVFFSNKEQPCNIKENYDTRIKSLENLCRRWSKRNLSIIGKINIVKVFGISLFTHLINGIGIDQKRIAEINSIIFNFIWKVKTSGAKTIERIKRKTLCNDKHSGGLNMIDLENFQRGFYLNWAEKLINNERHVWKHSASEFFLPLGGVTVFKSSVKVAEFKGLELIKNLFWRRVLETWLTVNGKHNEKVISTNDPIFNNNQIRYKNNVIFLPNLLKRNIIKIGDVFNQGKLLTINEIKNKYGSYPGIFLDYYVIFNAFKINVINKITTSKKSTYFHTQEVEKIGRKKMMKLIKNNITPTAKDYWQEKYGILLDKDTWEMPFKCTKEIKLQNLQYKVNHNIFPTASILKKMKIKESELCSHCNVKETAIHFFFECRVTKPIWSEIEKLIKVNTGVTIKINFVNAMFGVKKDETLSKNYKYINWLIMLGKVCISKLKYGPKRNSLEILESELQLRNIKQSDLK